MMMKIIHKRHVEVDLCGSHMYYVTVSGYGAISEGYKTFSGANGVYRDMKNLIPVYSCRP